MTIETYLATLDKRLRSGISREHAYRTDLESLIRELTPGVEVTNEPAQVTESGNPDFVVTRASGGELIPIGYIEAKDVGKNLKSKRYREQFGRYKKALDNLIITDYVWFQFFQAGDLVYEVRLAEVTDGTLTPLAENFAALTDMLREFHTFNGAPAFVQIFA